MTRGDDLIAASKKGIVINCETLESNHVLSDVMEIGSVKLCEPFCEFAYALYV